MKYMGFNETPTKGFAMDRNEKITAVLTFAVGVGSVALFAAARLKARNDIQKAEKNDAIDADAAIDNNPNA